MNFFTKDYNRIYETDEDLLRGCTVLEDVSDGARHKMWVKKDDQKFLYKTSKLTTFNSYTFEHASEFLVKRLCDALGVPCVDIQLGDHGILSRVMSNEYLQSFIEMSDEFSHSFHLSNLSTFNVSTLLNPITNCYYLDVVRMLLVDVLIGNSDRHPGNFMYSESGFYPLFDNGSSLLEYVNEVDALPILKDKMRFKTINESKSRPVVRDEQKLTHHQLLSILANQFDFEVRMLAAGLSNINFDKLFQDIRISEQRKELLQKFLEYRINWFKEIV